MRPSGGAVGVVSGAPSVGHPESNAHTHTHTNAHSLSLLVSLFFYHFLLFFCFFLFLLFAFGGRKGGEEGVGGFVSRVAEGETQSVATFLWGRGEVGDKEEQ